MSELLERLDETATSILANLEELGPETLELSLLVARLYATKQTLISVIFMILGLVIAAFCYRKIKAVNWDDGDAVIPFGMFSVVGFMFGVIVSIASVLNFSFHSFVGMFVPEVWIAAKILDKVF